MSLVIIIGGLLAFEATHSVKYWQSERITITGEQIAKRLENTRYGDRFYLLMDTQYGVMEIPVSYSLYIQSSNDEVHSLKLNCLLLIMHWKIPINWNRHTLSCSISDFILQYGFSE